jgi:hypothetical protein
VVTWASASQDGSLDGVYAQEYAEGPCLPKPGEVTGLFLAWTGGLTQLHATWNNAAGADSYTVFQDSSPNGTFAEVADAPDGATGLTFTPDAGTRYYIVRGRSSSCGLGP